MIIHGQENTKPSVILNILKWLMRLTVLWNSWKTFSGAPAVFFFMAQMTQILLLSGMLLLERSKIIVSEGHLFKKKKKLQWSFEFLSTLCKKVFSGATVKVIFVCASNNSDSVVFWNTALGDIKDHSLIMTRFEKKNCCESFGFVSTLHKKVFSGAPIQWIFLYGSSNSDSAVFGKADFATVWAQ